MPLLERLFGERTPIQTPIMFDGAPTETAVNGFTNRWHRPLLAITGVTAVLTLVAIVGLLVDHRTVIGSPAWFKPLKFAISFGIYAATIAYLLRLAPARRRWMKLVGWWAGTIIVGAMAIELVAIFGQAARGRASHFNIATPLDQAVSNSMATGAMLLWVGSAVVALVVLRQRSTEPATASAIRWGFVLSLIGMLVALFMMRTTPDQQQLLDSGQPLTLHGGHSVGVADGGPGLPLTGWANNGGDLRIPHFVGIHALQVLPLLALALAELGRHFPASRLASFNLRVRLTRVAAIGYSGLLALLTWQALAGQPLLRPAADTLVAAGVLAASLLIATVTVLKTDRANGRHVDTVASMRA